ncbi:IncA family protein [Chlamydia caviae]|nr:IncA family protein [Chlamydia caviae]
MKSSLPLGFVHTQQLASNRYNINKPHSVLISSVVATILGLAVLAASIALLVLFGAQGSAVFHGIIVGVILAALLLFFIGGIHSAIVFKLVRSRQVESSIFENTELNLQRQLQDLQSRLSKKESDICNLRAQLDKETVKVQKVLKLKQEELDSLIRRYAAMAQESSDLAALVLHLRTESADLKRVLEKNTITSNAIIEKLRSNSELLHSETIIARQSQEAEKVVVESLRNYSEQLSKQLCEKAQDLRDKDQTIAKLTQQVAELKQEIATLQIFITDNVANREQKRDVVEELNKKLAALKSQIESLQAYITESTKGDEIAIPTGNILAQKVNALLKDVFDIQEFAVDNIVVRASDDTEDQN